MKIHVLAENLQKKLSFVNHAISSKSQLPILSSFLLEAKDNLLTISSTDLEIGMQVKLPVEVEEEGVTTAPAKLFTELIASLSKEKITLQTEENSLRISSKKTKSSLQVSPKEDFPKLYEEKGLLLATVSTEDLQNNFQSVIFSASSDMARPALTGVLVTEEKEGFLLVATDGYRLSLKHYAQNNPRLGNTSTLIVPARIFRELLALKEDTGDVKIYISEERNQILLEGGESIIVGRLIEGAYPPYEKIIPFDFSAQTTFLREDLLKAVKICSIFARDSANIISLSLKKEAIIVSSQSGSVGENSVEVEAKLTGEENEIAFNARYLQDVLSHVNAEEMVFEMTGPLNPGVFKIKDDVSFLHLIMPIRTQE